MNTNVNVSAADMSSSDDEDSGMYDPTTWCFSTRNMSLVSKVRWKVKAQARDRTQSAGKRAGELHAPNV
jgi:hypothetical protein